MTSILAPHGTYYRAGVCRDPRCEPCEVHKEHKREWQRRRLERERGCSARPLRRKAGV